MYVMDQNTEENRVKYSPDDELACPYCGNGYLHHQDVQVFNREKEDSNQGVAVTVTSDNVAVVSNNLNDNPSSRRNGMIISFECENCGNHYNLSLYQDKGRTFLHWVR